MQRTIASARFGFGLWRACALLFGLVMIPTVAPAAGIETAAPYAILVDHESGAVLFEKNADRQIPPASLAKLMTVAVVFEELSKGRLSFEDQFPVSALAWRKGGAASGGSTMFAALKSSVPVEALIQGVIIQSANDGCIILAEGIAGSEEAFVQLMNRRAKEIGLTRSRFGNSTGLPHPEQRVTVRDLAKLARHLIRTYPAYYRFYSQRDFTWNKIHQVNRNPLLEMGIGADGLKTGYTAEAGYALVGSAVRDGRRLVLVVSGLKSATERAEEARKLIDWGFDGFEPVILYAERERIAEAKVFGGETSRVGLISRSPVQLLMPREGRNDFRARVVYPGPIPAPVDERQPLAKLRITNGESVVLERELYAAEPVKRGTIPQRALDAVTEVMIGLWQRGLEEIETRS